jgi:phosphoserine phosphatase RsbU/P
MTSTDRTSETREAKGTVDRILIVDDNPTNLQVLSRTLEGRGYELLVATSGEGALTLALSAHPDLILLDIMMPGIDGFETCRRLKSDPDTRDIAIVFMSALNETTDKVRGLDLGAVDYITKPFQAQEVIARVNSHLTIQRLQRNLASRNLELSELNKRMKNDLLAAARVQQSLLPRDLPALEQVRFEWEYQPCDELAGDSLNIFRIDQRNVGMYVLDVTGHGVPAALLSVAVTHSLSQRDPERSIITRPGPTEGQTSITLPAEVVSHLNRLFPMAGSDYRFFTMVYAVLDAHEGRLSYAAAGHPGPLILRANGEIEHHESTGLPIGVDDGATFDQHVIDLQPGDRVFLYSDGVLEEMNEQRKLFGLERLESVLINNRSAPLRNSLNSVIEQISLWTNGSAYKDDISITAAEILRP